MLLTVATKSILIHRYWPSRGKYVWTFRGMGHGVGEREKMGDTREVVKRGRL